MDVTAKTKELRQWSDEEMLDLLDKIQKGFTYRDVMDGKTVSMSTLWMR